MKPPNKILSLHPLKFKEAVSDILKVKPEPKAKPKAKKRGKGSAAPQVKDV